MCSRHTVVLVSIAAALFAAGGTVLAAGAATAPAGQPGDWTQFRLDRKSVV